MKQGPAFLLLILTLLVVVIGVSACTAQQAPPTPTVQKETTMAFAKGAFPPPMPDIDEHRNSWLITDCMKCHGPEAGAAPTVQHKGMPEYLLNVQCRSCHVFVSR